MKNSEYTIWEGPGYYGPRQFAEEVRWRKMGEPNGDRHIVDKTAYTSGYGNVVLLENTKQTGLTGLIVDPDYNPL